MRRRNSGDEDLRRLERLALQGDDTAYDRYLVEMRRRGIDNDTAAIGLLQKSEDPAAFLTSDVGEDARREIKDKAVSEANAEANAKSAEDWSNSDDPDEWQIAWFGDAIAVNGQLIRDGHGELVRIYAEAEDVVTRAPAGYEHVQGGGHVPGGSEQEISVEFLTEVVMDKLGLDRKDEALNDAIYDAIVKDLGATVSGDAFVYWTSDSGETELYRRVETNTCDDCGIEGPYGEGRAIQDEPSVRRAGESRVPELCRSCTELRESELTCAECALTGQPDGDVAFYDDPEVAGDVLCETCYSKKYPED